MLTSYSTRNRLGLGLGLPYQLSNDSSILVSKASQPGENNVDTQFWFVKLIIWLCSKEGFSKQLRCSRGILAFRAPSSPHGSWDTVERSWLHKSQNHRKPLCSGSSVCVSLPQLCKSTPSCSKMCSRSYKCAVIAIHIPVPHQKCFLICQEPYWSVYTYLHSWLNPPILDHGVYWLRKPLVCTQF